PAERPANGCQLAVTSRQRTPADHGGTISRGIRAHLGFHRHSYDGGVSAALDELIAALPEGGVVTDPDILGSYRHDRAFDPSAGTPLAVVRPRTAEDVQATLRWASAHKIAVVPRGMGTGLSGGASAL